MAQLQSIEAESVYQAEARDMAIDAVVGRIYWASSYSIDSTYLNWDDHKEIFYVPNYQGSALNAPNDFALCFHHFF